MHIDTEKGGHRRRDGRYSRHRAGLCRAVAFAVNDGGAARLIAIVGSGR